MKVIVHKIQETDSGRADRFFVLPWRELALIVIARQYKIHPTCFFYLQR